MGLLEKLWDETLAGPTPDSGLKKLRKQPNDAVSRNITLLRTRCLAVDPGSDPSSPTCSTPTTPVTPGTPSEDVRRFTRKKPFEAIEDAGPRSPTVCDWVLISALDR